MTAREDRINEARLVLRSLNFDAERCNERSALVLLALLNLTVRKAWHEASSPVLRTVEIMEWLRVNYKRDYKPNSRETIRRFTLHQFAEAGLIVQNPDEPGRPINSPKWCYQIAPAALLVLRKYDSKQYQRALSRYLADLPGLKAAYDKIRDRERIPVTLPGGALVSLSPGGQNILLKQMIEEFCGIFTPGGQVLYVGDADEKWMIFERESFVRLGIVVDAHGKMPDLVVHMPDRNWLVLLEAASSHGPVDAKRHGELRTLFSGSSAGLVFVSCFPSREEMRKYLNQIAWETEVWCADNPSHIIHFNGERFLGPYD